MSYALCPTTEESPQRNPMSYVRRRQKESPGILCLYQISSRSKTLNHYQFIKGPPNHPAPIRVSLSSQIWPCIRTLGPRGRHTGVSFLLLCFNWVYPGRPKKRNSRDPGEESLEVFWLFFTLVPRGRHLGPYKGKGNIRPLKGI
jgi:hypothetical protein